MASIEKQSTSRRTAIVNIANDEQRREFAESFSVKLKLPLLYSLRIDSQEFDMLFVVTDTRMELRDTSQRASGPVYVDFVSGSVAFRRASQGSRRQLIARAVGVRSQPLTVIDTTAGLGQDAFMLACLGC